MHYYFIDSFVTSSSIELNSGNGYGRAVPITQSQYEFGLANKGASLQEILDMELLPVPEPEPSEPYISVEERVEAIEELLLEML